VTGSVMKYEDVTLVDIRNVMEWTEGLGGLERRKLQTGNKVMVVNIFLLLMTFSAKGVAKLYFFFPSRFS